MKVVVTPYRYVKADTNRARSQSPKNLTVIITSLCLLVGVGLLVSVATPVTVWQISHSKDSELVVPLATTVKVTSGLVLGASQSAQARVAVKSLADGFSYFSSDKKATRVPSYSSFTLAMPMIGIDHAQVVVDSENFDTHLGHLPGTALPGEVGNVFVTGHSALPRFFSQANYKTIFTPLTKVQILDEITLVANKKIYHYSIEKKTVVDPSDISVIDPPDPFGKYLTVMTCVPPGLNTKRLIVLARLIE